MPKRDPRRKIIEQFPWQLAGEISRESLHQVQRPREKDRVDAFSQFRQYRGGFDIGSDDEGCQSGGRAWASVRPVERPIHYADDLRQCRIQRGE